MSDDALEAFVDQVCGDSHLRVEDDLGDGFVRLKSAEAERRQAAHDIRSTEDIVIEMLRNARDAHASSIFLAYSREGHTRRLVMIDDGDGIPPSMHSRVFEPRVTSKLDSMHVDKWGVHGRGMALYSIAVNAEEACVLASDVDKGSAFLIQTNLDKLGEKTDQSSFPVFEKTESNTISVRGPKNILRTACEFALESRQTCSVYVGSATEIAATLYEFGLSSLTAAMRAFAHAAELAVCKQLALAVDPEEFANIANSLGLSLSERSARRILDGEIEPVVPILDHIHIAGLTPEQTRNAKPTQKPLCDARGLKIDESDMSLFASLVSQAFSHLAQDYYLKPDVDPVIRVAKDGIRIFIPADKLQ